MTTRPSTPTRVLMLTHRVPYPPDRGDRIRSYHLLCELAGRATVDLACVSEERVSIEQHQVLASLTDRMVIEPTWRVLGRVRGVRSLMKGRAATPAVFYNPRLAKQIAAWHEQRPFDAVLTFCSGMVRYGRFLYGAVTRPPRVHILDLVDVDSAKWSMFARTASRPMRWIFEAESQRLRDVEAGRYDHFDAVSLISEREASVYREQVSPSQRLIVAGNGTDLSYFRPAPYPGSPEAQTVLFVGVLDYLPNVQAVTWFAEAVLPRVRQALPSARFVVVGRNPSPAVRALAEQPGVQVAGSVPDVRPYLAEASVVVAPMAIAPGVQNKVLEALASARPVVCSSGAAAGLEPATVDHLRIADTAELCAAEVVDLLSHPQKARELGRRGREHVETHYTWPARLAPLVNPLIHAGQPAWLQEDLARAASEVNRAA